MVTVLKTSEIAGSDGAEQLQYMSGFSNEHCSEALAGALPEARFSPQKVAYGLYAEKFTATAFTAPRASNFRNWFYRIRPSVVQGDFHRIDNGLIGQVHMDSYSGHTNIAIGSNSHQPIKKIL
jgi:homogentisate 1,2-dioxygenase